MLTEPGSYQQLSDNAYPTRFMLRSAKVANQLATVAGMTSLGLLAMLITHQGLKNKGWSTSAIIAADVIIFFTAISGKVAVVLFFNEASFLEGFEKICRRELPDYINFSRKNTVQKVQWATNFLLSANASFFWAALVQLAFKESGKLLKSFDTRGARFWGMLVQKWYVYFPFVLCAFYASMMAWPNAHSGAYDQKKEWVSWLFNKDSSADLKQSEERFHFHNIQHRLLLEIKSVAEGRHQPTVIIDQLLHQVNQGELTSLLEFQNETISKLDLLLVQSPSQLKRLFLKESGEIYTPFPVWQKVIKHGLAVIITVMSVYGYHNIFGLSHMIWSHWGVKEPSMYLFSPLVYYSNAEVVLLTVYPLCCNLFDVLRQGVSPYVFSSEKLAFIIAMVFFIGIFGGLGNSEQSYLDGEPTFDILIADMASFLVDAFSIYMVFKTSFEMQIRNNLSDDPKAMLQQRFLEFKDLKHSICFDSQDLVLGVQDDAAAGGSANNSLRC